MNIQAQAWAVLVLSPFIAAVVSRLFAGLLTALWPLTLTQTFVIVLAGVVFFAFMLLLVICTTWVFESDRWPWQPEPPKKETTK